MVEVRIKKYLPVTFERDNIFQKFVIVLSPRLD